MDIVDRLIIMVVATSGLGLCAWALYGLYTLTKIAIQCS